VRQSLLDDRSSLEAGDRPGSSLISTGQTYSSTSQKDDDMKNLICAVCEKKKPFSEIRLGRYCDLLVCEGCRKDAKKGNDGEIYDEQWLVVDADGCGYLGNAR